MLALEARCDSAVIWAVVLRRLRAGLGLAGALAGTIRELADRELGGRFNFLLTDGETIAATAAGDTLCYRAGPGSVVVASEPCDDEPGWADVPDRSVLTATAGSVVVRPIDATATAVTGQAGAGQGGSGQARHGPAAAGLNGRQAAQ